MVPKAVHVKLEADGSADRLVLKFRFFYTNFFFVDDRLYNADANYAMLAGFGN